MADQIEDPNLSDDGGMTTVETLRRAIGDRYLTYALSTIMHRALPDARDGLKPVHRRILYAMNRLKLASNGKYLKSAKISGDTMGDFHPHGDAAIYDAMARLAQDFNVRYPMVDGQGNFGNIDGDNPAAARYTEARMTGIAEAMLEGLEEDSVDFRDNYDGRLTEPAVLPASIPNLLANGSTGIAVGMATNIPPHNIDELCSAAIKLVKNPNTKIEKLMQFVPGPDFPTGGILVEPQENILQAYSTGRGSFRVRAKWELEELGRGQWQIVVTEIPYQVAKSKLIEKIAELINAKKIPILADVRDESADDIRLVLEPRAKTVDPTVLMETLFRQSDLETRFSLNMNVLIDGRTPKVCSLREVLKAFVDHRREVLQRRSQYRVDKIERRLEVLEGFILAFLNLDRVIDVIRYDEDPKEALLREDWSLDHPKATSEADYRSPSDVIAAGAEQLTEVQTEAILNMRLRSLRKLEEVELRNERDALWAELDELETLLGSEDLQWQRIIGELKETRAKFGKKSVGGERRTELAEAPEFEEVPLEAMIEREPITVVCSAMGWIRAMKGHIDLSQELKFKDGDGPRFIFHAETTDKLLLMGANGRFYTLGCSTLPGGRGMGEPVRLIVDLPNEAEMVAMFLHKPGRKLLVASSAGDGFVVAEDDVIAQTRTGKQVLNVKGDVKASICTPVAGDHVACVGENRKVLVFPIEELPEMGRGKGVRLQKYKDGGLNDATTFVRAEGLSWLDPAGRTRTETELDEWTGKRASAGRMAPRGFPRDNKF
ncbi:DNA topoisomerase IV subunit A [Amylibacter sp. IMCC11727]|uniref:DNA topoisomerase IV subunit A n=1 Tax=Amylibacter sp. IMCC11727 TaxID=3039851 RepID=UPI00244DEE8B|nr:DNA topoisomerase IV subunit A [Amylibacter sp. IMCC11727]WGI22388.1 DNA topoisomerase IV subunit A [Amylibacter sp. IMCC11727]